MNFVDVLNEHKGFSRSGVVQFSLFAGWISVRMQFWISCHTSSIGLKYGDWERSTGHIFALLCVQQLAVALGQGAVASRQIIIVKALSRWYTPIGLYWSFFSEHKQQQQPQQQKKVPSPFQLQVPVKEKLFSIKARVLMLRLLIN